MNILQYGKNPYFSDELRKMGHRIFLVGESERCDLRLNSIVSAKTLYDVCAGKGFSADVFLHADDSTLPHIFGVEELPLPAIFYSIDTYCHAWHSAYSRAFDHVLFAQGEERTKFSPHAEHFPLFAKEFSPFETREEWFKNRPLPLSFVGTMGHKNNPERAVFFKLFQNFLPVEIRQGEFAPVYKKTKIVLNQSAAGELNFRTFEAMALGCACLADTVSSKENYADTVFKFGENSLPAYPRNDVAKAVDYAVHWLSEEKKQHLYETAMKGRALVLEKHSAKVRALRLAELFEKLLRENCVQKRLQELSERRKIIHSAFAFLAEQKNIMPEFVRAYSDIEKKYGN